MPAVPFHKLPDVVVCHTSVRQTGAPCRKEEKGKRMRRMGRARQGPNQEQKTGTTEHRDVTERR